MDYYDPITGEMSVHNPDYLDNQSDTISLLSGSTESRWMQGGENIKNIPLHPLPNIEEQQTFWGVFFGYRMTQDTQVSEIPLHLERKMVEPESLWQYR